MGCEVITRRQADATSCDAPAHTRMHQRQHTQRSQVAKAGSDHGRRDTLEVGLRAPASTHHEPDQDVQRIATQRRNIQPATGQAVQVGCGSVSRRLVHLSDRPCCNVHLCDVLAVQVG